MAHSLPTVPIVDFSPFYSQNETDRLNTGRAIFEALRDVGFVYLTNHRISKELIAEALSQSHAFFDLPLQDKLKAPHPPESWNQRGYSQIGQEKISLYPDALNTGTETNIDRTGLTSVLECKESFDLGRENDTIMPNIYPPPELLPNFRDVTMRLFNTLHSFGLDVLKALALGLRLQDENFFSHYHGKDGQEAPMNQLRLLHYPPVSKEAARQGGITRIAPHTDKGTITLLLQEDDGVGGLEVEAQRGGRYVPVPVIPGSILLNIGDLLQMWSNDTLRSTKHHIGVPRVDVTQESREWLLPRRLSIPYFIAPDWDVVVECLDTPLCWGEGRPKKNKPMKAWDYIVRSMEGAY
ncbi:flavonol synthase/flavanone 3-hydroxylase [Tirmania nivea]|nr:flavonol synthase/flavanone 3-hydroxylase [Tirmania nivea]